MNMTPLTRTPENIVKGIAYNFKDINLAFDEYLKSIGVEVTIQYDGFRKHFDGDKKERDTFKFTISKGRRSYSGVFGDSHYNAEKLTRELSLSSLWNEFSNDKKIKAREGAVMVPSKYRIISCLALYDVPETFEEFCRDFGYIDEPLTEYPNVKKKYEEILREYNGVRLIFTDKEIEIIIEFENFSNYK